MLSQRWNAFRVCSASDEIRSAYGQHILNDVFEMGSNFLLCWALIGWACVEIGYLLAKHARKLVTLWLSLYGNWLLVGWAYAEIRFYWYWTMFFPLSPFPVPCLTSHVSCLKCLFLVSHSLFPASVPCLTSLFLVSHPLFLSHFSIPSFLLCHEGYFLLPFNE